MEFPAVLGVFLTHFSHFLCASFLNETPFFWLTTASTPYPQHPTPCRCLSSTEKNSSEGILGRQLPGEGWGGEARKRNKRRANNASFLQWVWCGRALDLLDTFFSNEAPSITVHAKMITKLIRTRFLLCNVYVTFKINYVIWDLKGKRRCPCWHLRTIYVM